MTNCINPFYAYDTGKLTARGRMSYYLDLARNSSGELLLPANSRIEFVPYPPYARIVNGRPILLKSVKVPCGKCPPCLLAKAQEWSTRMYFESKSSTCKNWYFVTLTYNDLHYSSDRDFKDDITKFLKRLRVYLDRKCSGTKLRFFLSNEYGEKTNRSHFHLILYFDSDIRIYDQLDFYTRKHGFTYYNSKIIRECWPYGFNVTIPSWCNDDKAMFGYVSRYCCKKAGDDNGFIRASRNPGLGEPFLLEHGEDLQDTRLLIHCQDNTSYAKFPKYFREKLLKYNPVLYEKIQASIRQYIKFEYLAPKTKYDAIPGKQERQETQLTDFFADELNKFKKSL